MITFDNKLWKQCLLIVRMVVINSLIILYSPEKVDYINMLNLWPRMRLWFSIDLSTSTSSGTLTTSRTARAGSVSWWSTLTGELWRTGYPHGQSCSFLSMASGGWSVSSLMLYHSSIVSNLPSSTTTNILCKIDPESGRVRIKIADFDVCNILGNIDQNI